jgi:hypothetical protein
MYDIKSLQDSSCRLLYYEREWNADYLQNKIFFLFSNIYQITQPYAYE